MGKAAKRKKERKLNKNKPVLIVDEHTGLDHVFSAEQMRVVAEMVHRARQEGREKAALEFVEWINTINEIEGIGPKRQRDIANHFLAYGPRKKAKQ